MNNGSSSETSPDPLKPRTPIVEQNSQLPDDVKDAKPIKYDGYVKDKEKRYLIKNTKDFPFRAHGIIFFDLNSTRYFGTGAMIDTDTVLTAGHNLYDRETKAYAKTERIQFVPGLNGQKFPFGLVDVEKYYVSQNYIDKGTDDYGIMILKKPIGEKTKFFHLSCLEVDELDAKIVNVNGYPGDKADTQEKRFEMWGGKSVVSYIDEDNGIIQYLMTTAAGQSGSGVYYEDENGKDFYICGIHIEGDRTAGKGTLLTSAIREQISAWRREFKESRTAIQSIMNIPIDQNHDYS